VTCPHCDSPLAVTDTAGNPWYCCGSTKTFRSMSCLDREPLATKLRAATERIKLLEAVTNDPHALWANWLRGSVSLPAGIGDVRQYQDRIKRLEEAGDKMEAWLRDERLDAVQHTVSKWRKAKEAKP
jgi:hypothetical protein